MIPKYETFYELISSCSKKIPYNPVTLEIHEITWQVFRGDLLPNQIYWATIRNET